MSSSISLMKASMAKFKPKKDEVWDGHVSVDESEEEDFVLLPEPNLILRGEVRALKDFSTVDKPYLEPKDPENRVSLDDKYSTACFLTMNLSCRRFLKYIKEREYRIEYYNRPSDEFNVQSLFLKDVRRIEVTDVNLNLDFMFHVVEDVDNLQVLTHICLRRCKVNEDMLAIICPELENAFNLTELDLSENPIGDGGFKQILIFLYDWTTLKYLILQDTELSFKAFDMLSALYAKRRIFLTKLDLSRNILNKPKSIKRLLISIGKQSPPLEELILTHCGFEGPETTSYFVSYLKNLKMLKLLDISFNLFSGDEDVPPFADLLMSSSLHCLKLSFNLIKEQSVILLLNTLYTFPEGEIQKNLVIENFSIPKRYLIQNPSFLARSDIVVTHAGIRELLLPEVEDFKTVLVKRLNFLYKKDRPPKDLIVESLKEYLPKRLHNVRADDFKEALLQLPTDKIDVLLIQEIVAEFSAGKGGRCNAREFINIYENLFSRKKSTVSVSRKSTTSLVTKSYSMADTKSKSILRPPSEVIGGSSTVNKVP